MRSLNYNLDGFEGADGSGGASHKNALLCSQCSLCEVFSCPIGLYPKNANLYYRQKLLAAGVRYKATATEYKPREFREFRLVSTKRLTLRLGLHDYDVAAPYQNRLLEPDLVRISTLQHVGVPAVPVVKVGDTVNVGQLIGDVGVESLGVPIHASIAGVVKEANSSAITIRRR
jgi:Na+-translocating ferredoxin:NAD+ oxidoreductase RnfC subunit